MIVERASEKSPEREGCILSLPEPPSSGVLDRADACPTRTPEAVIRHCVHRSQPHVVVVGALWLLCKIEDIQILVMPCNVSN